jgi:hypothetical protein
MQQPPRPVGRGGGVLGWVGCQGPSQPCLKQAVSRNCSDTASTPTCCIPPAVHLALNGSPCCWSCCLHRTGSLLARRSAAPSATRPLIPGKWGWRMAEGVGTPWAHAKWYTTPPYGAIVLIQMLHTGHHRTPGTEVAPCTGRQTM